MASAVMLVSFIFKCTGVDEEEFHWIKGEAKFFRKIYLFILDKPLNECYLVVRKTLIEWLEGAKWNPKKYLKKSVRKQE